MAAAAGGGHGLIVTRAETHHLRPAVDWPWFGAVQYSDSTEVPASSGPAEGRPVACRSGVRRAPDGDYDGPVVDPHRNP
jgi:hypothetical protein